jgi:glycosyltransferase involved in cell wall biosynthesis
MHFEKKTEEEQRHFFEACHNKYLEASHRCPVVKKYYRIAETTVCLSFAGESLLPFMTPALQHLEMDESGRIDFHIYLWDSESSGIEMVPAPCDQAAFTERGDIWGFNSRRYRTAFHWSEFSVNVMDTHQAVAVYWVKTPSFLPYWVYSAPLRSIFHWWMELNNSQLLHAAAVGTEEGAILITGKGGAGKSSTALSCLLEEMLYLGDDYLIVKAGERPRVYPLYSSAKLLPEDLPHYPHLAPFLQKEIKAEQEKQILFLYPGLENQIPASLPLKAIVTPEISGKETPGLSPLAFESIRRAMSFTTICQLPYAGEYTHDFIFRLLQQCPSFTLSLSRHRRKNPEILRHFLSEPTTFAAQTDSIPVQPSHPQDLPLISIIVPVYNGAGFIKDAVDNILSQAYQPIELIFVDDGSTDASAEIIHKLDVDHRYFHQENKGPAAARNKGIVEASGNYLAFLDVDDLWPENHLHYLLGQLQSGEGLKAVHGFAQLTELDRETGTYQYIGNPKESFSGYIGAGLYRRELFDEVGLFDTFLITGEDADWFFRLSESRAKVMKISEVCLFVRRHGGNMTEGKDMVELSVLKVFKRTLDRARNPVNDKRPIADISVMIPVHNAGKYLAETLHSVLGQDIRHKEVILVDDGSTDDSLAIARQFEAHCHIIRQPQKGAAAARNTGVKHASGKYLTFADADDLWEPKHSSTLLQPLEEDAYLDMVMGQLSQFISPELDAASHPYLREELKTMPGYHPGCMLIRKEAFLKVGFLNEKLQLAEFIDWFARASHLGLKQKMLDQVVYQRRIHTTNQGLTKKDHLQDYTSVLREALRRRKE